jgi:hypothetical protein
MALREGVGGANALEMNLSRRDPSVRKPAGTRLRTLFFEEKERRCGVSASH